MAQVPIQLLRHPSSSLGDEFKPSYFEQLIPCGSWLGCGDLPAVGAVFYLGAGWPQWKPLGIPGTHLPLKRGSWLTDDIHPLLSDILLPRNEV